MCARACVHTCVSWPIPASILYKSTAGRYRPVSYPDGPITARYSFIKNAYWDNTRHPLQHFCAHTCMILCQYLGLGDEDYK